MFNRRPRIIKFKEALAWSVLWFALAMLFAVGMAHARGHEEAVQFTTGYLIELSLSLDNILVIALIFSSFRVPPQSQHRVLFLGDPRRAGDARRDDRRRRGAHQQI